VPQPTLWCRDLTLFVCTTRFSLGGVLPLSLNDLACWYGYVPAAAAAASLNPTHVAADIDWCALLLLEFACCG
jgi:hypothetical protein